MLVKRLANESDVRINQRGAQRPRVFESLCFNGIARGIGMTAQFRRNGADFPVLGIEVTADLG